MSDSPEPAASTEVAIALGFEDRQRDRVAALYDAAFGAKLSIAIPDAAKRATVLARGFEPGCAFVALSGGAVVGVAGFKTPAGALTSGISFALLRETLGLLGAVRAVLILLLFVRRCEPGQLLMDGIAVSAAMRGRGVGTMLLHRLIDHARGEGFRSIRLDVIDTNPGARRLYERVGFEAVRTERLGALGRLLGFTAATEMAYMLADSS